MILAGIREISRYTLYDQLYVPTGGESKLSFFEIPWTKDVRGRWSCPYLRTNSDYANQLAPPNQFLIWRLNALFFRRELILPLSETQAYARTHVDFSILQKRYWTGPAWACASPFAIFATPSKDIPAAEAATGLKWREIGAGFGLRVEEGPANSGKRFNLRADANEGEGGLLIGTAEPFAVRVTIEKNNDPDLCLAIHLDGPIVRAVM